MIQRHKDRLRYYRKNPSDDLPGALLAYIDALEARIEEQETWILTLAEPYVSEQNVIRAIRAARETRAAEET